MARYICSQMLTFKVSITFKVMCLEFSHVASHPGTRFEIVGRNHETASIQTPKYDLKTMFLDTTVDSKVIGSRYVDTTLPQIRKIMQTGWVCHVSVYSRICEFWVRPPAISSKKVGKNKKFKNPNVFFIFVIIHSHALKFTSP